MGQVTAEWQVFVLYGFIFAIGNGGTSIAPVGVMVSRWFQNRRGVATSSAIAGNAVGQLVLIGVLAAVVTTVGWRSVYTILGIAIFVVLVPLVLVAARNAPHASNDSSTQQDDPLNIATIVPMSMRSIFGSRQFWLLLLIYGICGFQDFFVATHIVAFALDQGVGPVLAGNMLALMGLLGLIGVLISGLLSDAFGASRPTALCFLIRIGLFAFVLFFQDTVSILVFALLYGFTFLMTAPLTIVFAGGIFGIARLGTVSGLITMAHQIAAGLGAFVGAWIFDSFGSYDRAFMLALVFAVIAASATFAVRERPIERVARVV
jgi:nitrate/nitrite transporter NarK